MAPRKPISETLKKRLKNKPTQRNEGFKLPYKFFLVVCEGEETELNYFESLKKDLAQGVLTVKVEGVGVSGKSLLNLAEKRRGELENQGKTIDEVWLVFDKDKLPNEAFNSLIHQNNGKNKIYCGWSNISFELWLLLHFKCITAAKNYKELETELNKELKKLKSNFAYNKDLDIYKILKEHHKTLEDAIRNAKTCVNLWEARTDYASHNPCTNIHLLIEKLLRYKT